MELFEITNGGHSWPGAAIPIDVTCQDFSASEEIWRFFSQHTLHTAVEEKAVELNFEVYPNPSSSTFTVSLPANEVQVLTVTALDGKEVLRVEGKPTVSIDQLPSGTYFLKVITEKGTAHKTVIVAE